MQRGRFLDAFELNTKSHKGKFKPAGLDGKGNEDIRDFLIDAYSKLLPDVSRQLVNTCQGKRITSVWLEGKSWCHVKGIPEGNNNISAGFRMVNFKKKSLYKRILLDTVRSK